MDHKQDKAMSYMTPLLHPSTITPCSFAVTVFRDINNTAASRSLVSEMEGNFLLVQFSRWKSDL